MIFKKNLFLKNFNDLNSLDLTRSSIWLSHQHFLAHPKTALFISHCGANSVQEAAISNVPLICVPFKADQYYNAEGMASRGWATVLDIREPNMEILKAKLIDNIRWHLSKEKKPEMHMKNRKEMAKEFLDALVKIRDGDDEKHWFWMFDKNR